MPLILYGALGGLIPDAIRLIRSRHDPVLPPYLKSPAFYLGLALCVILGAVAARLLGAADIKQALAYGFSAPEILTRFLSKQDGPPPSPPSAQHGPRPPSPLSPGVVRPMTIREWWRR